MSNIEWTGDTWNPIVGCSRISDGCKNCYAETMTGHAQSQCVKCFGAGREFMFDSNGRTLGVIGQCDHQGERRIA